MEMGPEGLEPSTPSLKGSCSTIELQSQPGSVILSKRTTLWQFPAKPQAALEMSVVGEPALGVERGHAAGAGGGDGLPVVVVRHVAGREHAVHARVRPRR